MRNYIVDTYAWVSYFEGKKEFKEAIEENMLCTPSIVLAEFTRILARRNVPQEKRDKTLGYIKRRSLILSLDEVNAVTAGEMAEKERLHLIDAIIYSYVNEDMWLLTGDKYFMNKPFVNLIREKRTT